MASPHADGGARLPLVDMIVCPMRSPSDVAAIERVFDEGRARADAVVAIVGKTEGTGLHDDSGRELAHRCLREMLARRMGVDGAAIDERVPMILSGGCFGVIAPHVTLVVREWVDGAPAPPEPRLVVGRATSGPIAAEDIGRMGQVRTVADATRRAVDAAGVGAGGEVHCVMVKGPSLTWASIREAAARGAGVVTRDLSTGEHGAMSYANDASALGVALALGEVPAGRLSDGAIRRDWDLFSEVASTSSGGERARAEVLVMGNGLRSASALRIGHGVIRDAIDVEGVKDALRSAGLDFACCPSSADRERIVQVFAKLIVPGTDELRGRRITLADDHNAYRSAKAVGGALVASVTGDPAVFVSGGEKNSHQGPPGGSPVAAVVRCAGEPYTGPA